MSEPKKYIDHNTRTDLVCHYFTHGMSLPNIYDVLNSEYANISRDLLYHDLSRAANKRWLKFSPPAEKSLGKELKDEFKVRGEVHVPSIKGRMSVIAAAAELISDTIWCIAAAKARGAGEYWDFDKGAPLPRAKSDPAVVRTPVRDDDGDDRASLSDEAAREKSDNEGLPGLTIKIHIGFSGGSTMAHTADDLAAALALKVDEWEKNLKEIVLESAKEATENRIKEGDKDFEVPQGRRRRTFNVTLDFVLMNFVTSFELSPQSNPISFLSMAMLSTEPLKSHCTMKCFNATPSVEIGQGQEIFKNIESARKVREYYDNHIFDIVVSSCGSVSDPHSVYGRYYPGKRAQEILEEKKVVGDFLWLPITESEHFDLRNLKNDLTTAAGEDPGNEQKASDRDLFKYRPMTLLTLDDISKLIDDVRDVFLVCGPCGQCKTDKSHVLRAILNQTKKIVSHVIVDKETANATMGKKQEDSD